MDCIRDIVLEMKRRIGYDHVRCIIRGRDIKEQATGDASNGKKGLIEFALKFTQNELVVIHILKLVLDVFLNC